MLTHYRRPPLKMSGGTVFYFVTDGLEAALKLATDAAGKLDVRLGGGVSTVRQYLRAKLLGELHLALRPVLMGSGESLFEGMDWRSYGYVCERSVAGERATHLYLRRSSTTTG